MNEKTVVIAPWLEGGGAQSSLIEIMKRLDRPNVHLVILFAGSRNHEAVVALANRVTELEEPRSFVGTLAASRKVRAHLEGATRVYSLMRASHIVLGLIPPALLRDKVVASVHQLPSADRRGLRGRLEDVLQRRVLRRARLVSTPSDRARKELVAFGLSRNANTIFEPNLLSPSSKPVTTPREGNLEKVRLAFAGRLTPQKGLRQFLEMIDGREDLVVRIAGDGPEMADLAHRVQTMRSPEVRLIGRTGDVTALLDWADCAVMPSVTELSPVFVWESWSRGRGVIATEIPAFHDLSKVGPLVTYGAVDGFNEAIDRVKRENWRTDAHGRALEANSTTKENAIVEFLRS